MQNNLVKGHGVNWQKQIHMPGYVYKEKVYYRSHGKWSVGVSRSLLYCLTNHSIVILLLRSQELHSVL